MLVKEYAIYRHEYSRLESNIRTINEAVLINFQVDVAK